MGEERRWEGREWAKREGEGEGEGIGGRGNACD